jgi:hypothetical protein
MSFNSITSFSDFAAVRFKVPHIIGDCSSSSAIDNQLWTGPTIVCSYTASFGDVRFTGLAVKAPAFARRVDRESQTISFSKASSVWDVIPCLQDRCGSFPAISWLNASVAADSAALSSVSPSCSSCASG